MAAALVNSASPVAFPGMRLLRATTALVSRHCVHLEQQESALPAIARRGIYLRQIGHLSVESGTENVSFKPVVASPPGSRTVLALMELGTTTVEVLLGKGELEVLDSSVVVSLPLVP